MPMSKRPSSARFLPGGKPSEEDRAAGFELAASARRFSRNTKAVVDDKLSFSAVLMRAGEVEAANRLLAEVEQEVATQEAALIEKVNEVAVARSIERDKMTRARLGRTLAVALLGSSILAFSAAGAAVVGLFRDDQAIHGSDPGSARGAKLAQDRTVEAQGQLRHVRIANVSFPLTQAQFRRYTKLTSAGEIDERELQLFLLDLLPPDLAQKVHFAIVMGLDTLPQPVTDDVVAVSEKIEETHKEASPSPQDEGAAADDTEKDVEAEPTPESSESAPEDDSSPAPDESPEDQDGLPLLDDDGEG